MTGTAPPETQPSGIDRRHLLLVGAGPGLGMAVARRFAEVVTGLRWSPAVPTVSIN